MGWCNYCIFTSHPSPGKSRNQKGLAYSTGSQIGYMMMALGIAGLSTNFVDGYTAGFFSL